MTNGSENNQRNHILLWALLGILFIALIWFLLWFFHFQYYESTDDAYVNGNMINVRTVVAGSPIAIYADDTDYVEEGTLLVKLDPTEYNIQYEKQLENLTAAVLEVKQIYDNVLVALAEVESQKIALSKARYDFDNRSALVDSKAISREDFVHSRDELSLAESTLKLSEERLKVALDARGNGPLETHPKIELAKKLVKEAYYRLFHTNIYAPSSGYVAKRAVELGQFLTNTSSIMAIIPIEGMWIDANFKETDLTWIRIGQPVSIVLDLYGSDTPFHGHVEGIGMGSGSVFSLIPPQNATGNWIKIVQRLPVRIQLDPEEIKKNPLRLGLSCTVSVDLSNTDLPVLAKTPPKSPLYETKVFDMSFQQADDAIEKILKQK